MKLKQLFLSLIILVMSHFVVTGQAPLAQWNFNSNPGDGSSSTGITTPSNGSGTFAAIGGIGQTFATGTSNDVSSDNSGVNTNNYPAQGTANETAGVEFKVSTVGKKNIIVSWEQRRSNTAAKHARFQYTIDGTNWINLANQGNNNNGLFEASGGSTWDAYAVNLSSILAVNNNANFGFRIVAAFEPNTTNYAPANSTSNYSTNGTNRFDLVSINGTNIPAYTLQILHSSDGEASVSATVDMPHYAAIIDKFEDEFANSITVSSGDNFIPSPFLLSGSDFSMRNILRNTSSLYFSGTQGLREGIGRPDIACMNVMGFNASVLGNHEFDLGTDALNDQIGLDIRSGGNDKRWIGAQFPYLSANLDFTNDGNLSYLFRSQLLSDTDYKASPTISSSSEKPGLSPWTVIERGGEKIGIVGATTTILNKISSPGDTKLKGPGAGIEDMDSLAVVLQPYIDSLRNTHNINKIIVLAHLQQINLEEALATKLKGVDIVIAGGSHTLCADLSDRIRTGDTRQREYPIVTTNADNEPVAILNTTSEWKYVGRYIAGFDNQGVLIIDKTDSLINGAYAADSLMVDSVYGGNYNNAFANGTKGQGVKDICDGIRSIIVSKNGNTFGKTAVFLEGRRERVRTEETNIGNLTADANLWYAKQYDKDVVVSIKNGGGIRAAIGEVFAVGNNVQLLPPAPDVVSGKKRGDVSQLDIENTLRFNNVLSVMTTTAHGLRDILEHGVSASGPGITPGQFPQVGGVKFSFDYNQPAGQRINSMIIIDSVGNNIDTIVRNGQMYGDSTRAIKVVTLNFIAGGGDGYPFPTVASNRVDLDGVSGPAGNATFSSYGREQDAFAEYMLTVHPNNATAFNNGETEIARDRRIQQLPFGPDSVIIARPLGAFTLATPPNNARVEVRGGNNSAINVTWNNSTNAIRYRWLLDSPNGDFTSPLFGVNSQTSILSLTEAQVDALLAQLGVAVGDSTNVKWTVVAYNLDGDSLLATTAHNLRLVRYPVLGNFFLQSPSNFQQINTSPISTDPVTINWTSSTSAVRYKWYLDALNGSFQPGILVLPSDNNGTATSLTLQNSTIDALLAANGVVRGGSLDLKWTAYAFNSLNDSLQARQVFTVRFFRSIGVGVEELAAENGIALYPNPATNQVSVYFTTENANVSIYDLTGKEVVSTTLTVNNNSINTAALRRGMYVVRVETAKGVATSRLVLK